MDFKETITKVAEDINDGTLSEEKAKEIILNLFDVISSEAKLICELVGGESKCSYRYKDILTCKSIRNCQMCGN